MPTKLTLAFTVKTAGSSYGPAKAAADLDKTSIPLYDNPTNDPVLGQLFGLTVESDTTATVSGGATRTIVLDMTAPTAPPPFPCNPITATPPVPPYPLVRFKPLPGTFLTTPGSATVLTSFSQVPSLGDGSVVQFLSQPGVFYEVAPSGVAPDSITLSSPYVGPFVEDGDAVKVIPNPAKKVALYSTSPLDSNGVPISTPLPAGSGARSVQIQFFRTDGSGPFTSTVSLMGKFPVPVPSFDDMSIIESMKLISTGAFGNSVGQITLCELSSDSPAIPANATAEEFQALIDKTQSTIIRGLVYMPPSYFALAQQGASAPPLLGEFQLVRGGVSVATTVDQTSVLAAGNTIQFAAQMDVNTPFGAEPMIYTVEAVSPRLVKLTTPWRGLNDNPIASSATRVTPSPAAEPTSDQLSGPVAEFVNPGTAVPPPNRPLAPQTMTPSPTFLSGMFARTLQLKLAVPVVPTAIVVS